jgi:hypothetical protein
MCSLTNLSDAFIYFAISIYTGYFLILIPFLLSIPGAVAVFIGIFHGYVVKRTRSLILVLISSVAVALTTGFVFQIYASCKGLIIPGATITLGYLLGTVLGLLIATIVNSSKKIKAK